MPRDILSEYGPDKAMHEKPRASHGGQMPVRDVHNYQHPCGPTDQHHVGVGLGGEVHRHGTQGPSGFQGHETGSPGLHGESKGHGSNRRG
jgi:hypothetical protein